MCLFVAVVFVVVIAGAEVVDVADVDVVDPRNLPLLMLVPKT